MALHRHPVDHHAGLEVAADQPQHPDVLDSLGHPSHQHVVVDPVEELLQIHVHHPPLAALYVLARFPHGVVRSSPRAKAVAVLREGWVEPRLQYLQYGLLDQTVQDRGDAQFALPTAPLGNRCPSDGLGLVGARQQLLAHALPVLPQPPRQLLDRPAVDSGTAPIAFHALPRPPQVRAFQHPFHQRAPGWALVSGRRRSRLPTALGSRGFTPTLQRQLQLPELLGHGGVETPGRFALPTVRPFAAPRSYYGLC